MKLTLTDFSGNELKSSSHPVTVGAAASQRALRYGVRDYLDGADPGNAVLVCEFRSDKTAYRALQYFETMKNAALPAAAVRIRAEKPDAATCRITVSSDKLAKNLTMSHRFVINSKKQEKITVFFGVEIYWNCFKFIDNTWKI